MCARSLISTNARTAGSFAAICSMSGRKFRSKKRTRSCACVAIHTSWSACSRGLSVCSTLPDPETA
ncbi:hypothetical protein D3C80_2049830 [compost metagenome]